MKNKPAYFLFFCLILISGTAFADEKITSFDSLIQAQYDGSLIVTEKIAVYHEGKEIRRGIYRDLPTNKGEKYKLLEILRDGNPEPGFVETGYDYYRINTGNDDYLPQPALSELFGKEVYQEFMLYHPYTSNSFASGVSASARPPHSSGGSGSFGGGFFGGGHGGGGGGGR